MIIKSLFNKYRTFKYLIYIVLIITVFLGIQYYSQYLPIRSQLLIQYYLNRSKPNVAYNYLQLLVSDNARTTNTKNFNKELSLIRLLQSHVHKYPNDPYNQSHLESIAMIYLKINARLQAVYYLNLSKEKSSFNVSPNISLRKLQLLVKLEFDIHKKIAYYSMLLNFYPKDIDAIKYYYTLGSLYDSIADWDNAYKTYNKIFNFPYTTILQANQTEIENIFFRIHRKNSLKTPSWNTALEARQALLSALNTRSSSHIKSLQAPGFFTAQWQESPLDPNTHIDTFNLVPILNRSSLYVENKFSEYSKEREVIWATHGWERMGVWFMVFRNIQQPDTIAENGKWEWAGIYFGLGNILDVPNE